MAEFHKGFFDENMKEISGDENEKPAEEISPNAESVERVGKLCGDELRHHEIGKKQAVRQYTEV